MPIDVARGMNKIRTRWDVAEWLRGIQAMPVAPNQKAADNQAKYLSGVQAAVSNGTYAARNRAVSKEDFVAAATAKQSHFDDARDRAAAHWGAVMNAGLASAQDAIVTSVRAMPNATAAQRKARMNSNFDKMSALRGKFRYRQGMAA